MSISFSWKKLPVDSNGKAYNSLDEFQAAQLVALLGISDEAAKMVVHEKESVMELLELTMDARPSARGKPKPRKAKQQELPKVQVA